MDRKEIENEKVKRLVKWIRGRRAAPVRIDLEPTSTCNLKCKFCWARSAKRFGSRQYDSLLSNEKIVDIVHEGGRLGVIEWQIAGGWEPLMKPNLMTKITRIIKEYGMYGCITTNGTLFSDKLIKKLVEIGWDEILFSLEGPNAKAHDYITCVRGSFKRATQTMKKFAYWKSKFKTGKPKYSFHTVLTNKNYDKLADMIKLGFKLDCEGVNFEPLSVWSEDGAKLKVNEKQEKEVKNYARKALKIANSLNIQTNVKNLLEPKMIEKNQMDKILKKDAERWGRGNIISSPCFEPWLNLEIRVSGRVASCRLCDDDAVCENIQSKSLKEIWFGSFFQNLRKSMTEGKMPAYCYTCAAGNVVNMKKMRKIIIESMRS